MCDSRFKTSCLALGIFAGCVALCNAQVQIELTLLGPNEVPQRNMQVWVIPNSGEPSTATTDNNGTVRLGVFPTAYVTVWVDAPQVSLPRMSGRFSQKTSVYLGGAHYWALESTEYLHRFFRELEMLYQDEPLPAGLQQQLRQHDYRSKIMDATQNAEFDDDIARDRESLLESLDKLLSTPRQWYLGVFYEDTSEGVRINSITANSPAAHAGIVPGNVIVSVDGSRVGLVDGVAHSLPDALSRSQSGLVELQVVYRSAGTSSITSLQVQLQER